MIARVITIVCVIAVTTARIPPIPEGATNWHLIKLSDDAPAVWMSPEVVETLPQQLFTGDGAVKFMDLTDTATLEGQVFAPERFHLGYPTRVEQRSLVESLIEKISTDETKTYLKKLTDFHTRYYTSSTGKEAAEWIASTCRSIATNAGRSDVTVELFQHSWAQPSVNVKVEPAGAQDDIVIIGAHEDSINMRSPSQGRSPGADDDGTGTITVLETFRVLMESGFVPNKRLHFQFYAAEEVGLRGSDAMAKAYARAEEPVWAMLQFDMNGWNPDRNAQYRVITDYTNSELSEFLRLIIKEYGGIGYVDGRYGYAASDHASWHNVGYPACHTKETTSYRFIHSENDKFENIDHDYLAEFVKVAVGYAVELTA